MAMSCPRCRAEYQPQGSCPVCGGASVLRATHGDANDSGATGWQQRPLGRIICGLLLAQGLAHGLRMFFDASVLAAADPSANPVWSVTVGFLVFQVLQALGLLFAGGLAGAGQNRGIILGAIVGLADSLILLGLQVANGTTVNELLLYGQPLLHTFFGAAGGFIASMIWKPIPVVEMAMPIAKGKRRRRAAGAGDLLSGPISWTRVIVGAAIAAAGPVSSSLILRLLVAATGGELQITSKFQAQLITLEIAGLVVLLGGGIAGTNTFNGLKQGLCVGLVAGAIAAAYRLSDPNYSLEFVVGTGLSVLALSLVGGWFGCKLFPPVLSMPRRRISDAP